MAVIKQMGVAEENPAKELKRKLFLTTTFLLLIILLLSSCLIISIFILSEKVKNDCLGPKLVRNFRDDLKNENRSTNLDLQIVSRKDWGATLPLNTTPLKNPVPYVIISHTTTRNCTNFKTCSHIVRSIQKSQKFVRKFWDIGYNFLIGGDNLVYEVRGFENQGAFLAGYNNISLGIAFIGNFNRYMPDNYTIEVAKKFIEFGVQKGHIDERYKLFELRQFLTGLSPGDMLFENIKTWDNWAENIE